MQNLLANTNGKNGIKRPLLSEPFVEVSHTCLYMRFPLNDGSGVLHLTDTHFTLALNTV